MRKRINGIINLKMDDFPLLLLEPCPFCGGDAEIENTHTPCYTVVCSVCGAEKDDTQSYKKDTLTEHLQSAKRAIAGWNVRY